MAGKRAVLVASFGTSHSDACEKNIVALERAIGRALPGWTLRRAFTSGAIRRKLFTRDGVRVSGVTGALEKLWSEGFCEVLVQPTHLLRGLEYDRMVDEMRPFAARFDALGLGKPLLGRAEDLPALGKVLRGLFPAAQGTAVCLMGHGSAHGADAVYDSLGAYFAACGRGDLLVGTVEGRRTLAVLREQVAAPGAERVLLAPLMLVAGEHAASDMAGGAEDSWRSVFRQAGYRVDCVMQGLGAYPEVQALYQEHARAAAKALQNRRGSKKA